MKKIKNIHFVGIKGVGMAPLAIIAKEAGFKVSGCDINEEFITDESLKKAKITPLVGFSEEHLQNIDFVITTGAHGGFDNPEVVRARKEDIPIWTQGQAVGEFMKGDIFGRKFEAISVAGSHGKTTTTAMIATVLKENNLDPSFVVGTGSIPSLGSCGHFGSGKYFIAEADEYATEPKYDKTVKFLWHYPRIAVFTNIELDHTDLFPTVDSVRNAFLQFANQLPQNGVLIVNGDDPQLRKLLSQYKGRFVTFGYGTSNMFRLTKTSVSQDQTFFWLERSGVSLGEFAINVSGEHNALNATSVIAAALEWDLPIESIKKGLLAFKGSKRRFELVGSLPSGALLYDDYAHHPTEIKKTLLAFRQSFPKKKIVCIFQPHTYSRTKSLFEDFIHSFSQCDTIVMTNIYASLREEKDPAVSSEMLINKIKPFHKNAVFLPQLSDVVEYINRNRFGEDTVVITMGAGDVYKIASSLLASSV